jgi:hypothetical protein
VLSKQSGELMSVSTFPECPKLPEQLHIDGREVGSCVCVLLTTYPAHGSCRQLFGRMMQEAGAFDERMVEAIRRIRGTHARLLSPCCAPLTTDQCGRVATGKWRVIALTNNWSRSDLVSLGEGQPVPAVYAHLTLRDEIAFLGWEDGAVPSRLRAMFDDFCDSSEQGMRCVVPELAIRRGPLRADWTENRSLSSICWPANETTSTHVKRCSWMT